MIKYFFGLAALLVSCAAWAQSSSNADAIGQSQAYCPGLFNPSQFSVVGSNPASASWQGKAGGNMSGGGGKAGNSISTCGNWDMTFPTSVTAQQIDAATPNSGSVVYNGNYGGNSSNICSGTQTEDFRRFKVMNAGWDSRTGGNGYLYTVPTDPDTTFMRSIRLGNHCGGGREADQLIYQFKVLPQNALLVLYYAVSLDDAFHLAQQNPEFVIEVQTGTATGSTVISNLNTYTYSPVGNKLFFSQSSPESSSQLGDFTAGANGTHNCFLQWNKVVINLGAYLTKPVRILFGSCDCSMTQHYGYAYIAGYCRPMSIQVDGCLGNTNEVALLSAPGGLEDPTYTADPNYHPYQWYMCNNAEISADDIPLSYSDSVDWFNSNFTIIPGANSATLTATDSMMMIDGVPVSRKAFACVTTTYMNKSAGTNGVRLYPIVSRLFAEVQVQRPVPSFEFQAYCDGRVELHNTSTCAVSGFLRDSLTAWAVYDNPSCQGDAFAAMVGADAEFQSAVAGNYYVRIHVPTVSDGCYAESVSEVTVMGNPLPAIDCSNQEPCEGSEIVLRDRSAYLTDTGNVCRWTFSDGTTSTDSVLSRAFYADDTVRLYVENSFAEPVEGSSQRRHCAADTFVVIRPHALMEVAMVQDDTIVCSGEMARVEARVVDEDSSALYSYEWSRSIGGEIIQTGNVLEQVPDEGVPISQYFVKVTSLTTGCEVWDSVSVHVLNYSSQMRHDTVDICRDLLPYTYSVTFEDGIGVYDTVFYEDVISGTYAIYVPGYQCQYGMMLTVRVHDTVGVPSLVGTTIDESNRGMVYFDEQEDASYYKIFEVGEDGEKVVVDSVAGSPWREQDRHAWLERKRYAVSAVDYCGKETDASVVHSPIFLTLTHDEESKSVTLEWSEYEGDACSGYTIYRGTSIESLSPFLSGLNTTSIIDASIGDGDYVYKVSARLGDIAGMESFSNYVVVGNVGVDPVSRIEVSLSPNPTKGLVHISVDQPCRIVLYDMGGRMLVEEVCDGDMNLDVSGYAQGSYLIKAIGVDGRTAFKKLVVGR
ncbi:MAG: T9SS type A sorting domain-containing protein [Bacteroidales bacterium]|nr:T9SS type A sorting domain-containing protein [Bacteroidales bacterium]